MHKYSRQLAQRIAVLRAARGWTAERLATEVTQHGVLWSWSVVTGVEGGRRLALTVDELFALAGAFGIAPMAFFDDEMFMAELSVAIEGAELAADPEFQESVAQARRGELTPARTAPEHDEEADVPGSE